MSSADESTVRVRVKLDSAPRSGLGFHTLEMASVEDGEIPGAKSGLRVDVCSVEECQGVVA